MTTAIRFPPPARFRPAGNVTWAEFALNPPLMVDRIARQRTRGARGAGNRYERYAQEYLIDRLGSAYVPSRWFVYRSRSIDRVSFAQPDGLYFDFQRGIITCFEIKIRHTDRAWWQVRHLYQPIVRHVFGTRLWRYAAVEVVCWFDPHTSFPEPVAELVTLDAARFDPASFHVHTWRKNL